MILLIKNPMPNLSSLVVSDDRLFRYFLSEQQTFSIKSLAVTTQSGNPFSLLNLVQRKMATTWIHKFWKSLGLPLEKFPDCGQRLNDVIIKGKVKGNSSCLNEQHAQKNGSKSLCEKMLFCHYCKAKLHNYKMNGIDLDKHICGQSFCKNCQVLGQTRFLKLLLLFSLFFSNL